MTIFLKFSLSVSTFFALFCLSMPKKRAKNAMRSIKFQIYPWSSSTTYLTQSILRSYTISGSPKKISKKLVTSKKIFLTFVRPYFLFFFSNFSFQKLKLEHVSRCPRATRRHILYSPRDPLKHISISWKKKIWEYF